MQMILTHYLVIARDIDAQITDERYMAWTSEPTVITSDMHRGYVVPDGWDEYQFNRADNCRLIWSGFAIWLEKYETKSLVNELDLKEHIEESISHNITTSQLYFQIPMHGSSLWMNSRIVEWNPDILAGIESRFLTCRTIG